MTTILISCAFGEIFLYLCSWNVTEFPQEIGMLSGLVEAVRVLFSYLDRKLRRGPSNQVIAKSVELSVSFFFQACKIRIFQCLSDSHFLKNSFRKQTMNKLCVLWMLQKHCLQQRNGDPWTAPDFSLQNIFGKPVLECYQNGFLIRWMEETRKDHLVLLAPYVPKVKCRIK